MLAPGTVVHRYRIEGLLGKGGMGAVYLARDSHLDRPVALKLLSVSDEAAEDHEGRARLVREARAAAAINHPNAVSIYDAGDSEHGPYIVMELVEGQTLRERMGSAQTNSVTMATKLVWLRQIAEALVAAHARGLVHRDVKPENIMVRGDDFAKVLDFGIARRVHTDTDPTAPTHPPLATITQGGIPVGTPSYMAPEQLRGERVDERTDQFAWAVLAYEMLGGRLPWRTDGGQLGVVGSILADSPQPIEMLCPDVPPRLAFAISRALSKKPADRFADLKALLRSLEADVMPKRSSLADSSDQPVADGARRFVDVAPAAGPAAPRVPPVGASGPRVSEMTMRAALDQAIVEQASQPDGYSEDEVRAAAAGIGLSPTLLESAIRDVRASRTDLDLKQEILATRRQRFFPHLFAYLGVIGMLMAILVPQEGHKGWFVPALVWGVFLASHALKAFSKRVSTSELRKARTREIKALEQERYRLLKLEEAEQKLQRRRAKIEDPGLGSEVTELKGALKRWGKSVVSAATHEVKQVADEFERNLPRQKGKSKASRVRMADPSDVRSRAEQEEQSEQSEQSEHEEVARRRDNR